MTMAGRDSLAAQLRELDPTFVVDTEFSGDLAEGEVLRGVEADSCTFTGRFEGAALRDCTFTECAFVGANLSRLDLTDTRFVDCTFSRCKVLAVNFTVMGVGAISANPVTFEGSQLDYSTFQELDAVGFVFRECSMVEVDFSHAVLRRAVFAGSRLDRARFGGADLRDADLRGATGYAIDVRDTQIKGARFSAPDVLALLDPFGIVVDAG